MSTFSSFRPCTVACKVAKNTIQFNSSFRFLRFQVEIEKPRQYLNLYIAQTLSCLVTRIVGLISAGTRAQVRCRFAQIIRVKKYSKSLNIGIRVSRKNHGNRIFPSNQGNFYFIVTIKKIPVLRGSR